MDFLGMTDDALDAGFGLPLRRMAAAAGRTDMEKLRWLLTEQIQSALQLVLVASAASSLPIERAFAEVKRSEAPRLCHVATAGRNQVLRQHLRASGRSSCRKDPGRPHHCAGATSLG